MMTVNCTTKLLLLLLMCVCLRVRVLTLISNRVELKAWKQKAALSLKSNPTLFRVELFFTDNPAASHLSFSLRVSHPNSLHLIPLFLSYCLTGISSPFYLPLFSFRQFSQES